MRRTTNTCESKRLSGLYLAAPCGNDNDHLGFKRTTIHLNPAPPGKTHNPPNTHDPPLDRQQGKKTALWRHGIRQSKPHFSPFSLDSAWLFNIPWNTLHLLAGINSFFYQILTFTPLRLCHSLCRPSSFLPLFYSLYWSFNQTNTFSLVMIHFIQSSFYSLFSAATLAPTAPFSLNILYPS